MALKSPILLLEAEFVEIPRLLENGGLSWFKFSDLVLAFADYVQLKRRVCQHMPANNQPLPTDSETSYLPDEPVTYLQQCFHRISQVGAAYSKEVQTFVEIKMTRGVHGKAPVDTCLENMTRTIFRYLEASESYQKFRQRATAPTAAHAADAEVEPTLSDDSLDADARNLLLDIRALSWAMVFLDPYLTGQVYGDPIVAKHASTLSPSVETQLRLSHWFCYEAALFVFDFFSNTSSSTQTNRLNSIIVADWHDSNVQSSVQVDVDIPDRSTTKPTHYFLSTMSSMIYDDCRNRNLSPEEIVRKNTHLHFG